MKILFISDIHGISDNLELIDREIKEDKIDKLVVLGDLYLGGYDRNLVNEFLNKYKNILVCMKGNCDSLSDIYNASFEINEGFKLINVDNINIYITHGDKYNMYNNEFKNSVLVYGHEHRPYIKKDNDMIYINVGSISKPRGGSNPTYMIYNNKSFTIFDVFGNIVDQIEV